MLVKDIINLTYNLKKECADDITQLLDKYNCELEYGYFDTVLGYNHKINDVNYIYINNKLKEYEKDLVLLHEVGHIILHDSDSRLFLKNHMNEKAEYEANLFAVIFLNCEIKYCDSNNYFQKVVNKTLSSLIFNIGVDHI